MFRRARVGVDIYSDTGRFTRMHVEVAAYI